jgi:hypothetical protein
MSEVQYLVEKGQTREFVARAELDARLKDGWIQLGVMYPAIGATVPQPAVPAETPKPQGKGKGKGKDEGEAVG